VRSPVAELPLAADEGTVGMGGDDQAAGAVHGAGVPGEGVVASAVAPVDEGARLGAEGEVVAVAGGDLLAAEDEQVVSPEPLPGAVCRGGVVLGGGDEVEAGGAGCRRRLGGAALAVGVDGVQVAVAAVPGAAGALRPLGWVGGLGRLALLAVEQCHPDLVRHALGRDRVRAEGDVPGAGAYGAGQIAGGGILGADGEGGAGAT